MSQPPADALPNPSNSPAPPAADGAQEPAEFVVAFPDDPASKNDQALWAGVLTLLVLVSFWQSITGSFIWDDDHYISHNSTLLNRSGLEHIWLVNRLETVQYYPLTFTSFWIEHHIWHDSPLGYRIVNLALHASSAIVLWLILRRLRLPGAWVIAAIWAIHPLQTESVSWVSERKNILSGLFAFASALFYLEFAGMKDPWQEKPIWNLQSSLATYAVSLAMFVLAMLSKTVVATLPGAILLTLWWQRRLTLKTFAGLLPMFVIGVAGGWLTSRIETDPAGFVAATGPQWDFTFLQKCLIAGRNFWFYIGKLFAPVNLSFNYPRVVPHASDLWPWLPVAAAVLAVLILLASQRKLGRGPVAAVLAYAVLLFPAIGFFNTYPFRYSFVADHFQYLAGLPLIILAVELAGRLLKFKTRPAAVVCLLAILVLASRTWVRASVFDNTTALWEDTLAKNPDSWLAAYNLSKDRIIAANGLLSSMESILPDDQSTGLGYAAAASDTLDDAQRLIQQVLNNPEAHTLHYLCHNSLAEIDMMRIHLPKTDPAPLLQSAEAELQIALAGEQEQEADRPDPRPYYNLGLVMVKKADPLLKALPPMPLPSTRKSDSTSNISTTRPTTRPMDAQEQPIYDLLQQARGYFQQAIDVAQRESDRRATHLDGQQLLTSSAFQRGNVDFELCGLATRRHDLAGAEQSARDAIGGYAIALKIDPSNPEAHYKLALCFEQFNAYDEAIYHLKQSLKWDYQYAPAYNEIGIIMLHTNAHPTLEELDFAIRLFQDALRFSPKYQSAQDNLDKARAMLATVHPATNPATQSSTNDLTGNSVPATGN